MRAAGQGAPRNHVDRARCGGRKAARRAMPRPSLAASTSTLPIRLRSRWRMVRGAGVSEDRVPRFNSEGFPSEQGPDFGLGEILARRIDTADKGELDLEHHDPWHQELRHDEAGPCLA